MGMNFSLINSSMISQNPADSINLFWNERFADSQARQLMFMTPSFQGTICNLFPEYGMYGNSLLDPMLAIQQTMQQFQNGSWMQGGGWNFPFFGNQDYSSMWNNFWNRNNGNNGGSSSGELPDEYDSLKALLLKYKENDNGKHNYGKKIQEAINKSGNADEKMTALKEVYKQISKEDNAGLKNALLSLDLYKKEIIASGYGLGILDKDANEDLSKSIVDMYTEITNSKYDRLTIWLCGSDEKKVKAADYDILTIISEWNDTYNNKVSDKKKRSIIYHLTSNIPDDSTDDGRLKLENHQKAVTQLCNKLISRVSKLETGITNDMYAKLQTKSTALSDALEAATKKYDAETLETLAGKFEDLYVALRLAEASRISQNIQTKYSFINDIASDDTDFVNKDLIIEETKTDLKTEGFKDETITAAVDDLGGEDLGRVVTPEKDPDNKTAQEQLDLLVNEKKLRETNTDGVYTNSSNAEHKHYMIKGDKLVELVGVTNIDSEGNCTVVGEKDKKPINDVETIEVNYSDVKSYSDAVAKVDSYINDKKIEKLNTFDGITVYKSTGTEDGEANGKHQYFMIKDNKFQKINGTVDEKTGEVTTTSSKDAKALKDLGSDDLEEVSSVSGIWDAATNKERQEAADAKRNEIPDKLDSMGFECESEELHTYKLLLSSKDNKYLRIQYTPVTQVITIYDQSFTDTSVYPAKEYKPGDKITIEDLERYKKEHVFEHEGRICTAYQMGEEVAGDLIGVSDGGDLDRTQKHITEHLTVNNIRDFIDGYRASETRTWFGGDMLCQQIFTEDDLNDAKVECIVTIIELVIEYAKRKDPNLSGMHLERLQDALDTFAPVDEKTKKRICKSDTQAKELTEWEETKMKKYDRSILALLNIQ